MITDPDIDAVDRRWHVPLRNVIVGMVAQGVLLIGLITRRMGGIQGAGPRSRAAAIVLWVALFIALLGVAVAAAFGLAISSIVCPVDAYECPL